MSEHLATDRQAVAARIREILAGVVLRSGTTNVRRPEDIPWDGEFSQLGVSSVDLMSFVLEVEEEYSLDVLSDMLPEDLPLSVDGWADLVWTRLQQSA